MIILDETWLRSQNILSDESFILTSERSVASLSQETIERNEQSRRNTLPLFGEEKTTTASKKVNVFYVFNN